MALFETIEYLKEGNSRQQRAYHVLKAHAVMDKLRDFQPILTGTIPINIDIHNSDLDIICCWQNKKIFVDEILDAFFRETDFTVEEKMIGSQPSVLVRFQLEEFKIEIFGQNIPSKEQYAFRHMVIEHQILQQKGETFRQEIVKLKKKGLKTEPAFANILGLTGDPYKALLNYQLDDEL